MQDGAEEIVPKAAEDITGEDICKTGRETEGQNKRPN